MAYDPGKQSDFKVVEFEGCLNNENTELLKMIEKAELGVVSKMLIGTGVDMRVEHWHRSETENQGLGPMKGFFYATLFSLPFWATVAIVLVKLF